MDDKQDFFVCFFYHEMTDVSADSTDENGFISTEGTTILHNNQTCLFAVGKTAGCESGNVRLKANAGLSYW